MECDLSVQRSAEGDPCLGVFALFTDGFDNKSESSLNEMNEAVQVARKNGVQCFFLGANQDAVETGGRYGFVPEQCLSTGSDPVTSASAFRAMGSACLRSVSDPSLSAPGFTPLEREYSAPPPRYASGTFPPPRYSSA